MAFALLHFADRSGDILSAWETFRSAVEVAIGREVRALALSAASTGKRVGARGRKQLIKLLQPRQLDPEDMVAAAAVASGLKQWRLAYRLLRMVLRLRPADERVRPRRPLATADGDAHAMQPGMLGPLFAAEAALNPPHHPGGLLQLRAGRPGAAHAPARQPQFPHSLLRAPARRPCLPFRR